MVSLTNNNTDKAIKYLTEQIAKLSINLIKKQNNLLLNQSITPTINLLVTDLTSITTIITIDSYRILLVTIVVTKIFCKRLSYSKK